MSVALWWASHRDAQPWHHTFLTGPELKRAEAYRRDEDRARFTTANALLHLAAQQHLGRKPSIDRTCPRCGEPHGKPMIDGLHASVSHSGEWIAVALTELGPVGVDVEETTRHNDIASMVSYVFSPSELALVTDPEAVFYQLWTRKESILKATGEGLRVRMSDITASEYNFRDLPARPGYAAALTVLIDDAYTVTELDGSTLLLAG